jgi:hypothetical protein
MFQTASPSTIEGPPHVAKKRGEEATSPQINFRPSPKLWERLRATADALGLDLANLARTIVSENLYIYERRARQAEHGAETDD